MEQKILRSGYTTGTCAAAAAKAAACFLWKNEIPDKVRVTLPEGNEAVLAVQAVRLEQDRAEFRVQKDAGDDPDVTNAAWIHASVECAPAKTPGGNGYRLAEYPGLYLTGGEGIGIVTKEGLSCPVGSYAINPVPRRMILHAVDEVRRQCGMGEPGKPVPPDKWAQACIRIHIPEGQMLAERTFNPRLGIVGGISVIGTTGIVRPMSEDALLATIRLEVHMRAAAGEKEIILTPGNYGERFLQEEMGVSMKRAVVCSNFIADAVENAAAEGFDKLLLVGHIGKLIKVAGGARNTHSRYGDGRMEQMCRLLEQLVRESDYPELKQRILQCVTTDAALEEMERACPGLGRNVMSLAAKQIRIQVKQWFCVADRQRMVQVVTFSPGCGIIGKADGEDRHEDSGDQFYGGGKSSLL